MKKIKLLTKQNNRIDCINYSDAWDILIRAAAHYTDSYASDLLIDYEKFMSYVREYKGNGKSFIFGMRRMGVDHAEYVFVSANEENRYGKIFQLDVVPDKKYDEYVNVELWEIEYSYEEIRNNKTVTYAPIEGIEL